MLGVAGRGMLDVAGNLSKTFKYHRGATDVAPPVHHRSDLDDFLWRFPRAHQTST
jgi:hypothetical protein